MAGVRISDIARLTLFGVNGFAPVIILRSQDEAAKRLCREDDDGIGRRAEDAPYERQVRDRKIFMPVENKICGGERQAERAKSIENFVHGVAPGGSNWT